jgi:hypothetical protein
LPVSACIPPWRGHPAQVAAPDQAKARKDFFFEKKKQKTFVNSAQMQETQFAARDETKWPKFFGSFFQKRTAFSFACLLIAVIKGGGMRPLARSAM